MKHHLHQAVNFVLLGLHLGGPLTAGTVCLTIWAGSLVPAASRDWGMLQGLCCGIRTAVALAAHLLA